MPYQNSSWGQQFKDHLRSDWTTSNEKTVLLDAETPPEIKVEFFSCQMLLCSNEPNTVSIQLPDTSSIQMVNMCPMAEWSVN